MPNLESLLAPIRHSPQLPEAISRLQEELVAERQRRGKFYKEMTPEQKIEFIDGQVVLHSPARNRHLEVTKFVATLLNPHVAINKLGTIKIEKCLCVFPRNDYEPDIVYFGREKSASLTDETLKFPVPDLAVEILSKSTEKVDRGVKFEDFAANGVGEYWIIDADKSVIEQFVLREGEFDLAMKSGSGWIESPVISGFRCQIEAFFDEARNLEALKALVG
ncbi:MAG: Uma2 family endonuclease [Verrucomicrobiales bacterium]